MAEEAKARSNMSFFRYPGGKKKLKDIIVSKLFSLCDDNTKEFREPFFGGGSIGIEFLQKCSTNIFKDIKRGWINDFDIGIACLWTALIRHPQELKERIKQFVPSIDFFYEFKHFLSNNVDQRRNAIISPSEIVDVGFKKIAIHQISYSGLGTMSGGPLGGQKQESDYKVDCRWSPDYLSKKVDKIHNLFKKYEIKDDKCSAYDFEILLEESDNSVIFLDPPYFQKGNSLYQHSFSEKDHIRLSNILKNKNKWLLSYDDCSEIRALYEWAKIEEVDINYSITGARSKKELLISNG